MVVNKAAQKAANKLEAAGAPASQVYAVRNGLTGGKTNPLESGFNVVIEGADAVVVGGIAGFNELGHGLSKGCGQLFYEPFAGRRKNNDDF